MSADRPFDIVLFGATGFTGQIATAWMADHAPAGCRWTIAARRRSALEALADEHAVDRDDLIVADSSDADSIQDMVRQTRCVISFAGPFMDYSDPVVRACVANDTHYVDITGESPWVRDLIERHHDEAREKGTRIVPMCGFDSVPSDLGAWFAVRAVRERFDESTRRVTAAYALKGGGLNGGTLATGLLTPERYPAKDLANPFLLTPGKTSREQWSAHADPRTPVFDPERKRWMMPFVMGPVNTRVVRRSAYLHEQAGASYGSDFGYQEYLDVRNGSRLRAQAYTLGLGAGVGLMRSSAGRSLLRRFGPKPGEGPSEQARQDAGFRVHYRAESESGRALSVRMESPGDAGNQSTVRFACCGGLALTMDADELEIGPGTGGVLTPSFALGEPFLARLRADGVSLEICGD